MQGGRCKATWFLVHGMAMPEYKMQVFDRGYVGLLLSIPERTSVGVVVYSTLPSLQKGAF